MAAMAAMVPTALILILILLEVVPLVQMYQRTQQWQSYCQMIPQPWHGLSVTWPLILCYLLQSSVHTPVVGLYWVGSHPKCRHMPVQYNPQSRPAQY